ncbi:hypothetical protein BGZ82_002965 [Podila clonocystis]|nr:hypothetical protein BGZ82_002965 [Podila clonocystis]
MKSFTPIFVLAALFLSSTATASLGPCRSDNYRLEGADYYPSPMNPGQQVCITIDGKFKKAPLPAPGSKLRIEVNQGTLSGDWIVDLVYSGGPDDSNQAKPCFFLPPDFQTIKTDSKVSVRLTVPLLNSKDPLLCVHGTVTVA